MARVAQDAGMQRQWAAYVKRYPYVGGLELADACEAVCEIMEAIERSDGSLA